MVLNFRLLLIVVLLFHLVLSVCAFEPSGGVLVLDGDDDYAILPFAEHGYLIPANTFDFTVEVWFYPKSGPERGKDNLTENNLILSQPLALWNFDEPVGTDQFRDASGNGKTLIGMNGATTSGSLAVNPVNTSLTTTWGQIKSESR